MTKMLDFQSIFRRGCQKDIARLHTNQMDLLKTVELVSGKTDLAKQWVTDC